MIVKCKVCGKMIPKARQDAIPGVDTCVEHSEARPVTEDDIELDGPDLRDL